MYMCIDKLVDLITFGRIFVNNIVCSEIFIYATGENSMNTNETLYENKKIYTKY